ncbi:ribosomal P protein AGP2beta-1, putative [Bodo saltans]|uniref:Ribosomal P protein AGP2beta-1, putative n=1 Tax=Bodo saltans TaxID=75058 RepID=A0A0S4JP94_BODSA|nr:ribosomal P protein AGP2beta-1, putative [Bodo saltans]|eukprot:CUG91088.1 ribosomal P protein AGP2beta-1, putative [Bodo saltans]
MPLHVSRDSYESKQVTLADLVELCKDCTKYCLEKTERLVSNRGHAPRGWEKEYEEVANERRSQDLELCTTACTAVPRSCPSVEQIRAFERGQFHGATQPESKDTAGSQKSGGVLGLFRRNSKNEPIAPEPVVPLVAPTNQELGRCENAAERFSRVLFAIAQKPSKVHFDNVNPKTGVKMAEIQELVDEVDVVANPALAASKKDVKSEVAAATASSQIVKKPLDKQTAHNEILKRWSTSRRERTNMEELGVIHTHDETQKLKQEMQLKEAQEQRERLLGRSGKQDESSQEQGGSSGTVPKW